MKTYYNGQRSRRQEGTPPGTEGERINVKSDPNLKTQTRTTNAILEYKSYEQEDLKNVRNTLKTPEEKAVR